MIQKILKVKIQLKPDVFLVGLMDNQTERSYGILFLYIEEVRLYIYKYNRSSEIFMSTKWKDLQKFTLEECRLMELAKRALVKKKLTIFLSLLGNQF